MKKLIIYFDITDDYVIEEIMDFLIEYQVVVVESRVIATQNKVLFIFSVDILEYTKVFTLLFVDAYITHTVVSFDVSIEENCILKEILY
jgi:hypothetical protein